MFSHLYPHTLASRKPQRAVFLPAVGLKNVLAPFAQILHSRSAGVHQITLAVFLVCLFADWFHAAADLLDLGKPELVRRRSSRPKGAHDCLVHNVTLAVDAHFVRMLPGKGLLPTSLTHSLRYIPRHLEQASRNVSRLRWQRSKCQRLRCVQRLWRLGGVAFNAVPRRPPEALTRAAR